jgi:outer membrane protein assembly factor BamB
VKARLLCLVVWLAASACVRAAPAQARSTPAPRYVSATAFHVLPDTTSEESGYFSLCEGRDGNLYIGTAKYNRNAYLVEFDPRTGMQRVVLDTNKACGLTATGYAAQSKIHTRNFVGPSGKVYVGSKQGYRAQGDASEYPGGYVMAYDPRTGQSRNLGMPCKGEGVIDVVADEGRGLLYVVTCEEQHWMVSDLKGTKYRELGPLLTPYATTLVAADGRAYALTADFKLAQYDPATGKVTTRPIEVGGKALTRADNNSIPTWVLTPDRRRAYLLLMNDPTLLEIDLTGGGDVAKAVSHGKLIEGKNPDSRCALSVAPDGRVYALVRVDNETGFGSGYLHHLVRFDPAKNAAEDLGVIKVSNPGYFNFGPGPDGNKPRHSHGFHTLPDGALTPLHVHMALIVTRDHTVYATVIYPFTLLRIEAFREDKPRTSAAERFVDFALGVCDRAEGAKLEEIAKVAEVMADRHLAGGMIGFPVWEHTLTYELWGRAGGVVHVGFDRPWKKDRTAEEQAKDVAIVSYDGLTKQTPGAQDVGEIKKAKSRGAYVIGLGPKDDPRLGEVLPLCDAWIDSDVDRATPPPAAAHTVANVIHGWTLTAEFVAALTRRGKMPPMWLSFEHPGGKAWAEQHFGKRQFHDDLSVPPIPAGELGRRTLRQFRHPLRRLRETESANLREAAELIAAEAAAGRKAVVGWSGHMPHNYVGKSNDPWARPFELPVALASWPQGIEPYRKDAPEESLVIRLGTCGLDPAELKIHQAKKQRLIVLTGTHDDPAWNVAPADALVRIDTGAPFADACVPLDGYPIRIIPASGLAQLVAYQAVVAEVNTRRN